MVKEKEVSRADKLAALREKMAKVDVSTGNAGFLRLKDGRNVIRIMPEVEDMQFFFQALVSITFLRMARKHSTVGNSHLMVSWIARSANMSKSFTKPATKNPRNWQVRCG
jgi:hypothetical protein